MSALKNFEDIEAWKTARVLTRCIYTSSALEPFSKDFELKSQIRKAAVSVMSNIAEGFERGGAAEFKRFLAIAKGSAGEVQSQLYVALDVGYINNQRFDELQQLVGSTKRLIAGFMNYLETRKPKKPPRQPTRNQQPAT